MNNNTSKKKGNSAKKLIPAAGMLAVSASMLATSTYAWFTMSREVEVTGINMSAVVPEDLQISLGDEATGAKKLLSANTTLDGTADGETQYEAGTQVFAGTIKAPTTDDNTNDWHNSIAFSDFYKAARLNPASSTDGNYLFKTADATDQGTGVSNTAKFDLVSVAGTAAKNDMAGLYVNGTPEAGNNGVAALEDRANAGYYVDFPIWFRTSSTATSVTGLADTASTNKTLQLGVKATITQYTGTEAKEDLYHAVRIAVLPATANTAAGIADTSGSITGVIHDGVEKTSGQKYYDRYSGSNSELTAALVRQAVKAPGTLAYDSSTNKLTNVGGIFGEADIVKQVSTKSTADGETDFYADGEVVVKVPLATNQNEFGTPVKYIIRVWLEGEDQYCWNPNAGQDWNVALQFVKLDTTAANHAAPADAAGGQGTASASAGTATAAAVPTSINVSIDGTELGAITIASNKATCAEAITNVLDSRIAGTGDKTYTLADGTRIGNSTDLAKYVEDHLGKYDFSAGIKLTTVS